MRFPPRHPFRFITGFFLLVLLSSPLPAPEERLSFQDLIHLARSRLDSAMISAQIEKMGLDFQPTPRQLAALGEAGLEPEVLSRIVRDAGLSIPAAAPRETVRVFRRTAEDGRAMLVLTNLDEEGNPIRDPAEEPIPAAPPAPPPAAAPEPSAACPAPREEIPAPSAPADPPQVVVNIEIPQSPQPWFTAPVVAVGGIAGPYQYPERLGFLGYGPGLTYPRWFSGLGMNPSSGYGLPKQDQPGTAGREASSGPPAR